MTPPLHTAIVIGPPRSGTTLLGSLLSGKTGVVALSEPLLAHAIFPPGRYKKFLRRISREAGFPPAQTPANPTEAEFLHWILDRAAAGGASAAVVKETYRGGMPWPAWNNADQLDRLLRVHPPIAGSTAQQATPWIAIVRHPYAVAASTIRLCGPLLKWVGWGGFCWRLFWPVLPALRGPDEVVAAAARNWTAFVRWKERQAFPVYRYEDLVESPAAVLKKITADLGLAFEDAMLDARNGKRCVVGLGDNEVLHGRPRAVDRAALARGGDLTDRQRAMVKGECAAAAATFGYDLG
ncbi:MAG: sulfotransferase [Planctomycetes bacterium]|nr:sulfotransferase [Planctomycetota bacterium]